MSKLSRLIKNTTGSASVFVVCLLPMVLALCGLAIDGANAWRMRAMLQVTADASALAASMDLPNAATALATAQNYAAKNMPTDANGNVLAVADITAGHWDTNARAYMPNQTPLNAVQVTVRRSAQNNNALPVSFLSLIGWNNWDVVTTAIATNGAHNTWVSLVLDNTGSMSETDITGISKIIALRTAAHQLLDKLKSSANEDGDVQVAIVPFAKDVNVGTANINATWLDWTDWEAVPANGAPGPNDGPGTPCPYSTNSEGYGCQSTPTNGSSSTQTIPSTGSYAGYICPGEDNGRSNSGRLGHYYNGCYDSVSHAQNNTICSGHSSCSCNGVSNCTCSGSGHSRVCTQRVTTFTHTWHVNAHTTWNGCVMDRAQVNDVENTTPTSSATNFPTENAESCVPSALGGLGYNWTALGSQIDQMAANGSTNQTIGLAWGWQAQTQGSPLNPPAPPQNVHQVIILLSDGLNTQNRWSGDGSNESTAVDNRMAAACNNAKAAGMTIYTVFVDLNGTSGNSAILRACASDPNKYFDLTTSGQIVTTFNEIANQISYHRVVF